MKKYKDKVDKSNNSKYIIAVGYGEYSNNYDYHFAMYRNGYWMHKPGNGKVRRLHSLDKAWRAIRSSVEKYLRIKKLKLDLLLDDFSLNITNVEGKRDACLNFKKDNASTIKPNIESIAIMEYPAPKWKKISINTDCNHERAKINIETTDNSIETPNERCEIAFGIDGGDCKISLNSDIINMLLYFGKFLKLKKEGQTAILTMMLDSQVNKFSAEVISQSPGYVPSFDYYAPTKMLYIAGAKDKSKCYCEFSAPRWGYIDFPIEFQNIIDTTAKLKNAPLNLNSYYNSKKFYLLVDMKHVCEMYNKKNSKKNK